MEGLKKMGDRRGWKVRAEKKGKLTKAYKEEDFFGSRKVRFQWLIEDDKNTRNFQALTAQRRSQNKIEQLEKEYGGLCENEDDVVKEIS